MKNISQNLLSVLRIAVAQATAKTAANMTTNFMIMLKQINLPIKVYIPKCMKISLL